jgi:hypothetical protein
LIASLTLGTLLLLTSAVALVFHQAVAHPGSAPLPDTLAGLQLVDSIYHGRAVDAINRLHGLDFSLSSAAVGAYQGQAGAILWVSGAPTSWHAMSLTKDMRDRIAEGNNPYTPLGEREVGGTVVYALEGLGQRHYYFRAGSLMVWLAVDEELAEAALQECLSFYR